MEVSYFLGTEFKQREGKISANQSRFTAKILDKFGVTDCKARESYTMWNDNWQ